MLCACSGEQFKFEEPPQSPESLATRDFSASCLSSRTGDWDLKFEDSQVDEVESTLKEALSLNYEEARALLGRLEYQRGNFDAALQVFQGIDIRSLTPRMVKAITEKIREEKPRPKGDNAPPTGVLSMHSVSLLLEAILLKAKSLEELGRYIESAKECRIILDTVESALPNGMPEFIGEDCKFQEMLHKALELLPTLWIKGGYLDEAINAYRRVLVKPWNLDPNKLAAIEKELAGTLLYGGVEASLPLKFYVFGPRTPKNNVEEAILLLLILMRKVVTQEINWDPELMNHLTFALSITRQFELLAEHVEQILPGIYSRAERWYFLALCYNAAGQNETALNLLMKVCGSSEVKQKPHFHSFLLLAKLCSEDTKYARDGIKCASRMIDMASEHSKHFNAESHKFLGVCYGNAARASVSDSERTLFQKESLNSLRVSSLGRKHDPEVMFNISLENAVQRNLDVAFYSAMAYSNMVADGSGRGWKLLTLILSAERRLKDAETIVDFALDEAERMDQLEFLRLKAVLKIAQEQPKQAIETYRILLALIQARDELQLQATNLNQSKDLELEAAAERDLERAAWQDLAAIYSKLASWADAEICLNKAKTLNVHCPRGWHTTGKYFEARSLHKEALVSYSVSLSVDPDYIPSIISTAEVLMKCGNQSLPIARSLLMNAVRLDPTSHEAWFNLGVLSKMEGLLLQAADFFQAAHELQLSAPPQSFI
ncbi:Protein NPGR1 [Cucurbita argyrosperma subsp. argyrosperma]|nr:Protein NPGR1 [Cucurbita argyrosperma subsp. argyrosperma]